MEAFTYSVSNMLSEFVQNMALVLLCIFAFSGALVVFQSPGFHDGLLPAALKVVKMIIGLGVDDDAREDGWGLVVLIAAVVVVDIGKFSLHPP